MNVTDHASISALWMAEVDWTAERCAEELAGERWQNFLDWGEQIYWRGDEPHPRVWFFLRGDKTWIEVSIVGEPCESLSRFTPWGDEPS